MKPMIIAQISDTHILSPASDSDRGPRRAENLRRCVSDILRQKPDAVVHTGDITQHGLAEEYEQVREILAPIEAPVYLIPGNRDDNETLRAVFSDRAYWPENGGFLHYAVDDHPFRLVALDSTAAGERKGVFCEKRQAWLEKTLQGEAEKPTILFIHHPPFDLTDFYEGGYRRPEEREALAAVVSRHPQVEQLLCGHVHRQSRQPWAGTTATTMTSVAVDVCKDLDRPEAKERPVYQLHRLSIEGGHDSQARIVPDS